MFYLLQIPTYCIHLIISLQGVHKIVQEINARDKKKLTKVNIQFSKKHLHEKKLGSI